MKNEGGLDWMLGDSLTFAQASQESGGVTVPGVI